MTHQQQALIRLSVLAYLVSVDRLHGVSGQWAILNSSVTDWRPQCANITTAEFIPDCLPKQLRELKGPDVRAIWTFVEVCGIDALRFRASRLHPTGELMDNFVLLAGQSILIVAMVVVLLLFTFSCCLVDPFLQTRASGRIRLPRFLELPSTAPAALSGQQFLECAGDGANRPNRGASIRRVIRRGRQIFSLMSPRVSALLVWTITLAMFAVSMNTFVAAMSRLWGNVGNLYHSLHFKAPCNLALLLHFPAFADTGSLLALIMFSSIDLVNVVAVLLWDSVLCCSCSCSSFACALKGLMTCHLCKFLSCAVCCKFCCQLFCAGIAGGVLLFSCFGIGILVHLGIELIGLIFCVVVALLISGLFMLIVWASRHVLYWAMCCLVPPVGLNSLYSRYPLIAADEMHRILDFREPLEPSDGIYGVKFRAALQRLGKWTMMSLCGPVLLIFAIALLAPAPDLYVDAWSTGDADLAWRFDEKSNFLSLWTCWKVVAIVLLHVWHSLFVLGKSILVEWPQEVVVVARHIWNVDMIVLLAPLDLRRPWRAGTISEFVMSVLEARAFVAAAEGLLVGGLCLHQSTRRYHDILESADINPDREAPNTASVPSQSLASPF